MLNFEKSDEKRTYVMTSLKEDGTSTEIAKLVLIAHSVTNKFEVIIGAIQYMCTNIDGFENWYTSLFTNYISSGRDSRILLDNKDNFLAFAVKYVEHKGVNFDNFVNLDKKSKTSIIFYPEDLLSISIVSTALKLYSVFMCEKDLKLPENLHKKLYEELIQPCIDRDVISNIYKLIRSRTYRSSITDKYMWDFIRMMISETPESYAMLVFNFLVEKILILINVEQNPIPFLISTIDDSIKWLMRSIYKERTIYGEVYGGVEDLYGSTLTKENFSLLCTNDIIGKAAKAGMNIIENKFNDNDEFNKFSERLDAITMIYPAAKLVTLPLIAKVFDVSYVHLQNIPPRHAALLGILLYEISEDNLRMRFPYLCEFFHAVPQKAKLVNAKSSYRVRNVEMVLNDGLPLFGFMCAALKEEWLSSLTGILSASKKNMCNVIDGKGIKKMTLFDLESDTCGYFSQFYSNKLDPIIGRMSNIVDAYL